MSAVARLSLVSMPASPMSATTSSPAWNRPGAIALPTFGAWKVTVTVAWTAAPDTVPVDASTPEGRSTARTGTRPSFSSPMARSASGRGLPLKPVPKRASTATSASPCSSTKATPASFARPSMTAASPVTFSSGPSRRTAVSTPARVSSAAVRSPSPPFAPVPHQTATRRAEEKRERISSATLLPARSISSRVGPGYAASAARISSEV